MLDQLHVHGSSGVPIFIQVRDQMLRLIGAGALKPGEQMPTMRQVAVALKIDLNTVKHAYQELEKTGAITIVRAKGTYVAKPPAPMKAREHEARLNSLALQSIATAKSAGIDTIELAKRMIQLAKDKGDTK
ncbi:MAG TPA: GntR family transcriptional regulator [Steroidobacteraceae bacterium]|nr:GntR family transcriptional regulator [Steroidobacteraceae bacterium]